MEKIFKINLSLEVEAIESVAELIGDLKEVIVEVFKEAVKD